MWRRAEMSEVMSLFELGMKSLHPDHRRALEKSRTPPRWIAVADCPGEAVVAVAAIQGKLLYWSDVEGGWELEAVGPDGTIESRGCNQFELQHIARQAFGEPGAT